VNKLYRNVRNVFRCPESRSQIVLDSIPIDIIRKNIKGLRLAVYRTGEVRLSAAFWLSDGAVREYAASKLSWIRKHREKLLLQKPVAAQLFVSGESHDYGGCRYVLEVVPHTAKPKIILDGTTLKLFVRESSTKHRRAEVLAGWYRERLKEKIPGMIAKWEERTGVEVYEWGIKRMKTRWGSCSIRAHRIWLNLELAKKPDRCLEYVVVHEMVHLLERNHSKRFYARMTEFLPEWKSLKEELNNKPCQGSQH
jgi:predicted metal-dependent hydrolase